MRAHEAGSLHADGYAAPSWLRPPRDVNALVPSLWASSVRRRDDGALEVGGAGVDAVAAEFGTPAYPAPIVDARAALSFAKERLYGSRKSGLPSTVQVRRRSKALPPEDPQGSLF